MEISRTMQDFIAHFGEMGNRWGINRTVGQIYALLFLSEKPLCADEIGAALGCSRSNISMGLKELDGWRLMRIRRYPKDRKDYFTVPEDIWEIVRTLIEERKKREIDPTLSMLRSAILEEEENSHAKEQIKKMHDLIDMLSSWHREMESLDNDRLVHLLSMGSKIYKLYEMRNKLKIIPGTKQHERRKIDGNA